MSTPLKFEFDFDEVFEGIKQGVIRELEEMNFDAAKDNVINQIKSEIKSKIELTYSDERELKDEIKNEIKERVYDSIIKEVGDKYADKFNVVNVGLSATKTLNISSGFTPSVFGKLIANPYENQLYFVFGISL